MDKNPTVWSIWTVEQQKRLFFYILPMSSAREACLLASCKHCVEKIGNFDLETLSDTEVCKIQFNPTENFLPVTFVTSVVVITIQINMSYGIGGLMTQAHSALRFDCQLIDTSGSTDPHAKCR